MDREQPTERGREAAEVILLAFLVGLIAGMGLIVWLSWPDDETYEATIQVNDDGQITNFGDITFKPDPLRTPDRILVEVLCDECGDPIYGDRSDLCINCEMADEEQRNWDRDR